MDNLNKQKLLELAITAAQGAAELITSNLTQARSVKKEAKHDIKIIADQQANSYILKKLTSQSTYPVLSEEGGTTKALSQETCWIVDPLDGSLNFSREIPLACISIALWQKQQPILGVIFDFNRQELFSAIVNRGAWLNGQSIRVSRIKNKSKAILGTGFPSGSDLSSKTIHFLHTEQFTLWKSTSGKSVMASGFWHHEQNNGQPLKKTVVRMPGPS